MKLLIAILLTLTPHIVRCEVDKMIETDESSIVQQNLKGFFSRISELKKLKANTANVFPQALPYATRNALISAVETIDTAKCSLGSEQERGLNFLSGSYDGYSKAIIEVIGQDIIICDIEMKSLKKD